MLPNRLAIIFLLTRRASSNGLGVRCGTLEDDNSDGLSNCSECNSKSLKERQNKSVLAVQYPVTPYHKLMFDYRKPLLFKNTKLTNHLLLHSAATPETSPLSHTLDTVMTETMDEMALHNVVKLLIQKFQSRPNIKIRDISKVEKLLRSIVSGGNKNLQVVLDFDYTMTRVHKNGERLDCSWGVMENSKLLPLSYVKQTGDLRAKYLPIEQDATMTAEEKTPYMVEWYTQANILLSECGAVKRQMFYDMVKSSNVELRQGTEQMMNHLLKSDVPILVLSAGLGDLVEEILNYYNVYHTNVKIVSNFLDYDVEGNIIGLAGDVIHVFNKNEKSLKPVERTNAHTSDVELVNQIQQRGNVLLMGDSLGDPCMADGIENPSAVLKIGFLNHDIKTDQEVIRLKKYLDAYDVVLIDDQTVDVFNMILDTIDGFNSH